MHIIYSFRTAHSPVTCDLYIVYFLIAYFSFTFIFIRVLMFVPNIYTFVKTWMFSPSIINYIQLLYLVNLRSRTLEIVYNHVSLHGLKVKSTVGHSKIHHNLFQIQIQKKIILIVLLILCSSHGAYLGDEFEGLTNPLKCIVAYERPKSIIKIKLNYRIN